MSIVLDYWGSHLIGTVDLTEFCRNLDNSVLEVLEFLYFDWVSINTSKIINFYYFSSVLKLMRDHYMKN